MEIFIRIAAVCVVTAALSLLLKEQKSILAFLILIALLGVTIPTIYDGLKEILDFYRELCVLTTLPPLIFAPMLKVIGIGIIVKLGTTLCQDAQAETAAAVLEMCGICCALMAALPLVQQVLDMLEKFL